MERTGRFEVSCVPLVASEQSLSGDLRFICNVKI